MNTLVRVNGMLAIKCADNQNLMNGLCNNF
jgi:hypothetical protein